MKDLKFLIPVFLMFACGGGEDTSENTNEDSNSESNEEVVDELVIDISLNKISEFPSECKISGNVVDAYSWSDQNGTNYFIRTINEIEFSEGEHDAYQFGTQYLWAYHYAEDAKGNFRLLKETTDFIKDCEFDIVLAHELDAIALTDLDEDEIGEISFIYRKACTSDVSPSTQKLIMLEDGNKYPLRGNTQVMDVGGDYEVGEEFDGAPDSFLEHAKKMWTEHLTEYDFDL